MKILILMLAVLMLTACGNSTEPKPEDRFPAESFDEETETAPETAAETTDFWQTTAEWLIPDALEILNARRYLVTGDVVWEPIPRENLLRLTIPTDMGEIELLYTTSGKLVSSEPNAVERVSYEIEMKDYSLSLEAEELRPATVHNIEKYLFTPKDAYHGGQLIRITSAAELDTVYECFSMTTYLFEEGEYYEVPLYDDAWFDTHDLCIAVMETGGSFPDLERMEVVGGNELRLGFTHSDVATEDVVGRHVYIEVNKGDIITWSGSDNRYHTAETYAAQTEEWVIEDCRRYAFTRIQNCDAFLLAEPEYRWTTLSEVPDNVRSDYFTESAARYNLTQDSRVLRFDLTASTGEYVLFFTEEGRLLNLPE